ncbi:MAG: phosphate ABC transporter substrate-binding protein [Gammaproteobacteria bacterium]|nr:phosphate ABC transporter substrate-binding protein [Gammaproteobacteria bacterium]
MKYLVSSFVLVSSMLLSALASAEVEVIVHPSNNSTLDQDAIQRIYLGKTRAFPNGGEAVAISAKEGSPEEAEFTEKVLSKTPKQLKAYWAKMVFTGKGTPPRQIDSAAEMVKLISANPNLIGFVPAGSAGGSVKVVGKF